MLIKIPLFLPVNDENSFNQIFFLVRQQSGRVKRHAYSYGMRGISSTNLVNKQVSEQAKLKIDLSKLRH